MAINKALINIAQSYAPKWGIATEEDMHKPLIGSRRITQMAAFPATRKGYEIAKTNHKRRKLPKIRIKPRERLKLKELSSLKYPLQKKRVPHRNPHRLVPDRGYKSMPP